MLKTIWTKEKCHEIALKYNNRSDFYRNNKKAASAASYNKWYDEITSHMPNRKKFWTYESCKEVALTCKKRSEFSKKAPGAYSLALEKNWLSELCSHMPQPKRKRTGTEKPNFYWTQERCRLEALKYNNKTEFMKKANGCYQTALKKGWLDQITNHFEILGNKRLRFVYAYEFEDNHVYVGLTGNLKNRHQQHISPTSKSVVRLHLNNTGTNYVIKIITPKPLPINIVGQKETDVLNEYKKNGWVILNKQKTGGLGGCDLYWTKDMCIQLAKEYNTKIALYKANGYVYRIIYENNWVNEAFQHTKKFRKDNGYWTLDKCREIALKYETLLDFRKNDSAAYAAAYNNNWIEEMAEHMHYDNKRPGYWNYERCKEEALKYNNINLFKSKSRGAHAMIYKYKWFELISHIKRIDRHERNYWNYDRCKEEALKYKNGKQFEINSKSAYQASYKNKWLNEFFPK